jgi:hypothetical protein
VFICRHRLLGKLDAMLSGSELPVIGGFHSKRHDVPDMGFAPEPVYLINALAQTRDPRLATRLRRVADMLYHIDPAVSDYRFSYLHSIGYAAELLATPEAGAVAEEMMLRGEIRDQLVQRGAFVDARATSDYIAERFAYLGLCLARGAARCGFLSGYARLADYLEEMRLYLARSARRELVELLGCDHGFDRQKWIAEFENRNADKSIRPQAFIEIID